MSVSDLQTWFPHPQDDKLQIHVIFDVCHIIKLMQNLLRDKEVIQHVENGKAHLINWHCIEALNDIQENLGFSLENKLKKETCALD